MTTIEKQSPLGDYTITPRVLTISAIAVAIGVVASYVAFALLRLIGLATNLFFFGRWSTTLATPADHHLGPDRKSTRLNSSHIQKSRMPSSA